MANITPNHPAVKVAHTATKNAYGERNVDALEYHATALSAALTYLTTATPDNLALIRDTPVGRALTAEGKSAGWDDVMNELRKGQGMHRALAGTLSTRKPNYEEALDGHN